MDGFVQCYKHAKSARVCCRGYFDAFGENGCTAVQLAIRFERMGLKVIEHVGDGDYQPEGDEDDEEEEEAEG